MYMNTFRYSMCLVYMLRYVCLCKDYGLFFSYTFKIDMKTEHGRFGFNKNHFARRFLGSHVSATSLWPHPIFSGIIPVFFVGKTMPWTSHFKMVYTTYNNGDIGYFAGKKQGVFAMNSSFWLLTALILIAQWRKIPTFIAFFHMAHL